MRTSAPVLVCLFGDFRVLKNGRPVPLRHGGKIKRLLATLALSENQHATRATLIEALWSESDPERGSQSLNTLVHGLRRLLADVLPGTVPLLRSEWGYRLNIAGGIDVDTLRFDARVAHSERAARLGDAAAAVTGYEQAIELYHGDLCPGDTDLSVLIERERLRGVYLNAHGWLALHHCARGDYARAMRYAQRMLLHDPCREDGHRMVMLCHARLGQRAQAMNQYRLCREILRREFDAEPEPATEDLFRQLRTGQAPAPRPNLSQTSFAAYRTAQPDLIDELAALDRTNGDGGRHNGSSR